MPHGGKRGVQPAPKSRREALLFLIVLLLAVVPYLNTLLNDFVYDDNAQVINNPYAHSFRYLRQIFTTTVWSFQGAAGVSNYYRPMMTFGYLLTYQIAGLVPFSFHLDNLVLNALVVWLVFCILRRLNGERVGLVAAGLFALHPVHTESVAWIAAVTDLELAVFYLAAFLLFLRLPETKSKGGTRTALCACFALALLSKEQAMTLPVLATIFEHFYRSDRSLTTPKEKLFRYGPLWIVLAFYLLARAVVMGGVASTIIRPNLSWYETLLSAISLAGSYVAKLLWPVRLSAFYVFHPSRHLADGRVLFGLAAVSGSAALFARLWRQRQIVSFAFVWLFLPLGPVLNARWMPASVFGERYLYLPSIGFCWLLAWSAVRVWSGGFRSIPPAVARTVPAAVGLVALLYAVKTVSRNPDWRSDDVLYRRAIEVQGETSMIRSNLAANAFNRGDPAEAERNWLMSLSLGPSDVFALNNMALLRRTQHRYFEALDYARRALRLRPMYTEAHLNLAQILVEMGCTEEADWEFRVATALSPLSTTARNSYGKFLLAEGRAGEARAQFERSAAADFTTDACDHLGEMYLADHDLPRAEKIFRRALAGNAFDTHAHFGLASVLEAAGRAPEALGEYQSGLAMDPTDLTAKAAATRLRGGAASQSDRH
jgi:Tfp pilus assembly protein PilF